MQKMTLNRKLGSMIAVLWTGLILIGIAGVWQNRASMIEDREGRLVALVQEANSVAKHYYDAAQQHAMSEDDAKKQALQAIGVLRYSADGYYSINDSHAVMLMHPIKPQLVGKDLSNFTDPAGNHLFLDIVKAANQENGGFVHYLWSKPGSEEPVS